MWSVLAFLAGVLIGCLGTVAKFGGDVRVLSSELRSFADAVNYRVGVLEARVNGAPAPPSRAMFPSPSPLSQGA